MSIKIAIFEDNILSRDAQENLKERGTVPAPSLLNNESGRYLEFVWHDKWNHLSAESILLPKNEGKTIDNTENAIHALRWAMAEQNLTGLVVFVDLRLGKVDPNAMLESCLNEQTREKFLRAVETISGRGPYGDIRNAAQWLADTGRQGFAIAWGFLQNESFRDSDLWISSSVVPGDVEMHLLEGEARRSQRGINIFNAGGSISTDGWERIEPRFQKAIRCFCNRVADIGRRLWTNESRTWFLGDNGLVPHNWTALEGRTRDALAQYRTTLADYLKVLTGRSIEPDGEHLSWFENSALHETLKHLVGSCAIAHDDNGGEGYQPSLQTLVLLLAAAESDQNCIPRNGDWFLGFRFHQSALQPMLNPDCSCQEAQEALRAAHHFFEKVVRPRDGLEQYTNVKSVRIEQNRSFHLLVDCSIDCVNPQEGRVHSLLEKLWNRPWMTFPGDTMAAYWEFRQRFKAGPTNDCRLALTVYPVHEFNWTCFDFYAR